MKAGSLILASSTVLRTRYLTTKIYGLGPRPLLELFCDLIAASSLAMDQLEAYGRLDADFIRSHGADKLPPNIRIVK